MSVRKISDKRSEILKHDIIVQIFGKDITTIIETYISKCTGCNGLIPRPSTLYFYNGIYHRIINRLCASCLIKSS